MAARTRAVAALVAAVAPTLFLTGARAAEAAAPVAVARDAEPVVILGAALPTWSRLPAEGAAPPWPHGAATGSRDAHAGSLVVPPDPRPGVRPDMIAAFSWNGERFVEIPVQVDERFPYFLQNIESDFALYSATDEELTYEWDIESWRKTEGECFARYPDGVTPMQDPVRTLDDDDEIVLMASDAGIEAPRPSEAPGPPGSGVKRQEIRIVDPLDPTTVRYVYLFARPGGSSFTHETGYVRYERDANADEWIDRYSFPRGDPEMLGTSNTGYGPNLRGTVCRTAQEPSETGYPQVADGTPRPSTDRFPRDGVTVETATYRWHATGRWMVRSLQVAAPGRPGEYGPDLIDRWKGRAYQQSPDSEQIADVGFEDEQVNWEANSALLGERFGPVRAIRETWGADSGTNVTKTEYFYRDAIAYRFRMRVHPIPPDGIYAYFDHNAGVAVRHFNAVHPGGVPVDGVNDDQGNVQGVAGREYHMDVPDPTFGLVVAPYNWDQVSGAAASGSLVYISEPESPTTFENPTVVPFYRDDKCYDDGTGDDPVPRPWPGEPSDDPRVVTGYRDVDGDGTIECEERQGAWGSVGTHFLLTGDTDNAFQSKPLTELDATQWQFTVPTASPAAVGEPYANVIRAPLQAVPVEEESRAARASRMKLTVGDAGGAPQATAILTDRDTGARLSGREIHFWLGDEQAATVVTDENGRAMWRGPPGTPDGTIVRARFDGDDVYWRSEASARYRRS